MQKSIDPLGRDIKIFEIVLQKNKITHTLFELLWSFKVHIKYYARRQSYFTRQADIPNYWFLTSMVIHQSKAINLNLMKSQFAYSAFHFDIFYIATVL